MKNRIIVLMLLYFVSFKPVHAQIKLPEQQKKSSSKPKKKEPVDTRATVEVVWEGEGTVIIGIGSDKITLKSGGSGQMKLKPGEALSVHVEKPGKKYYADDFLLVEKEGGTISIELSGDAAVFDYLSLTEARRRAEEGARFAKSFEDHMVFVEGGSFTMGCTSEQGDDCDDDEKPAHRVTLDGFYISKHEVTQGQWEFVMGNNPSYFSGCSNCPVEQVSWNDVQEFIRKLNAKTGKRFRLPTEAEWEYAARGGAKSRGYKYSGSNSLSSVDWYYENSGDRTHEVGQKQPNELGIYDMSGNVWEWCSDWYGDYSSSSQTNPKGPSYGEYRVVRGGSWLDDRRDCRVSYRYNNAPDTRRNYAGFRLSQDR